MLHWLAFQEAQVVPLQWEQAFSDFEQKPSTGTAIRMEVLEETHFHKISRACTFGSAVPDLVSDLALVRGSDDGSVHSTPSKYANMPKYNPKP